LNFWDDKRLVLGLLAAICLGNFSIFSTPLYIGGLIDAYGFDETFAGLISTLEIGSTALVCLLLPNRVAKVALRRACLMGAVVALFANLATPWISSFSGLAIIRLVAGIGVGITLAVVSTILARSSQPDRLIAIVLVINTMIMTLALVVMGYAKQAWLFNGFIYTFVGTMVLVVPLLWLLPKTIGDDDKALQSRVDSGGDRKFFLGVIGVALVFVFCLIEGSVLAFSERSGLRVGLTGSEIGLLLAGSQISGLVGASIPAVFGDRLSPQPVILICLLLVSLAGVAVYHADLVPVYVVAMLVFSFGFFAAIPYLIGICARLDSNGVWAARGAGGNLLGGGAAPFVAGTVVGAAGHESLGLIVLLFGLASMVCTIFFFRASTEKKTTSLPVSN